MTTDVALVVVTLFALGEFALLVYLLRRRSKPVEYRMTRPADRWPGGIERTYNR